MSATIIEDWRIHINLQTQQKFSYLEDKKNNNKNKYFFQRYQILSKYQIYIFPHPISIEIKNTSSTFSEMDLKAEDGMEVGPN